MIEKLLLLREKLRGYVVKLLKALLSTVEKEVKEDLADLVNKE